MKKVVRRTNNRQRMINSPNKSKTKLISEIENCKGLFGVNDPLLSPLLASHDMIHALPPTHLISTDIDPCLDESIAFSNKLVKAGVRVIPIFLVFGEKI